MYVYIYIYIYIYVIHKIWIYIYIYISTYVMNTYIIGAFHLGAKPTVFGDKPEGCLAGFP